MKTGVIVGVALAIVMVAAIFVYVSNQPHYQLSTASDGTITRMDTRTGVVEVLKSSAGETRWVPLETSAAPTNRSQVDNDFDVVMGKKK